MKKEKKKVLIGYYTKSVILTYLSVISAIIGMYIALIENEPKYALLLLIISGLCDAFDGKVARSCKRTEQEKQFGVELDSLADLIAFIMLPIIIFYSLGLHSIINIIIFILFALGGVIRLAYFNTIADQNAPVKYYSGLPVTSTAIIFPIFYLLTMLLTTNTFNVLYTIVMLITSFLFVLNFKIRKPQTKELIIFLIGGLILGVVLIIL